MRREDFLKRLAIGTAGILSPIKLSGINKENTAGNESADGWIKVSHSYDDYNAIIKCDRIRGTIKLFHISDSHLSILSSGKSEYPEYTGRMDSAYNKPKHYITGIEGTKEKHFESILKQAKEKEADLILLTGDIINNPTTANVSYVKSKLDACGIEYIYTAGNHDWHFEGMKGKQRDLHEEWVIKRLKPLCKNDNPFFSSRLINGVNFVIMDNSTYQVNDEQVKFFREQAGRPYPVVLCMHIPIYQHSDLKREIVETMGDPRWSAEYDRYYIDEKRERWPDDGNKFSTYQFLIEILSCRNLLAVFAGHDHAAKQNRISFSAFQYLTKASYSGAYRYIEIKSI